MTTAQQTVHIAAYDTISDWEIGYVTAHLSNGHHQREPGRYRIATVGLTAEPVTTMGGLRLLPDMVLADLDPAASSMLVLTGANTWETGDLDRFTESAAAFLDAGVPVAAICGATYGLAAAGLLDARAHTSNDPSYLDSSGYAGAKHYVTDQPAVIDGDLITASGIAPVHFARAVFERLDVYEPRVLESWFKLYADRDPAGFFELMAG
jgi:putative intracellular protease/amidase